MKKTAKHKGYDCKILQRKGSKVYIERDMGNSFDYGWVDKSEITYE